MAAPKGLRLLPWTGPEGKPSYLAGDGSGYLSRLADDVEAVQLRMADELLGHAADLLTDRRATAAQLHFLACRLGESLRDVVRVAESRGARLPGEVQDDEDEINDQAEQSGTPRELPSAHHRISSPHPIDRRPLDDGHVREAIDHDDS